MKRIITYKFNNGKNCRQAELENETLEEALTILLKNRRKYKSMLYNYIEGNLNEKPKINFHGIAKWENNELKNTILYNHIIQ